MARTDYGAILSTVIKDTSDAIRTRTGSNALIAPADWDREILKMEALKRKTATGGSIVTFNTDIGGAELENVIANITPVQAGSGDPSPSNPRAITGWSAVNTTRTGVNLWHYGDISGTRYASVSVNIKAGTYNISAVVTSSDTDASDNIIGFRYADGTYIYERIGRNTRDNTSVILAQDTNQIRFYASDSNAHSIDDTFTFSDIQLQTGSTATAYTPYTGQIATINLGGTYYGGSLNVGTGVLTVTREMVDMGTINWSKSGNYDGGFSANFTNSKLGLINLMCTCYKFYSGGFAWADFNSYPDCIVARNSSNKYCYIKDTTKASMSATDFKDSLSGQYLVYELDTPQTYQLTPAQITQLLGENNVWADSGDMGDLTYFVSNGSEASVKKFTNYQVISVDDYNALATKDENMLYITNYNNYFYSTYYVGEEPVCDNGFTDYDLLITQSSVLLNDTGYDTDIDLHTTANINRDWEFRINYMSFTTTSKSIIIGVKEHDDPYFWFWTESGKVRTTLDGRNVIDLDTSPETDVEYLIRKEGNTITFKKGDTVLSTQTWDTSYTGSNVVRIGNAYGHGYFRGSLNYLMFKWLS